MGPHREHDVSEMEERSTLTTEPSPRLKECMRRAEQGSGARAAVNGCFLRVPLGRVPQGLSILKLNENRSRGMKITIFMTQPPSAVAIGEWPHPNVALQTYRSTEFVRAALKHNVPLDDRLRNFRESSSELASCMSIPCAYRSLMCKGYAFHNSINLRRKRIKR